MKATPIRFALLPFFFSLQSGCLSSVGSTPTSLTPSPSSTSAATATSRPISDTPSSTESSGTDPLATSQWHLKNTAQSTYSTGHGVAGYDLNLDTIYHTGSTGVGVVVMVADDGVESAHEDLHSSLLLNESRDYSKSGSYAASWAEPIAVSDNHGTAVAGIIAASAENSLGVRGVAPGVKLINANPLSDGLDTTNHPTIQIDALKDVLSADFDIINESFGLDEDGINIGDSTYKGLMTDAATNGRNGKGKIITKAAGNSYLAELGDSTNHIYRFGNANFDGYNTTPYTIVVGAMNSEGYPSSYSSPGSAIWISGPGGEFGDDSPAILTTDASGCNVGYSLADAIVNLFDKGGTGNAGCKYTSSFNGTSAATPMISGVVALLLEANPSLTFRDIKYILAKTARKVRPTIVGFSDYTHLSDGSGILWEQGWVTNAAGFNFNNFYGFGLADAGSAVALAKNFTENLGVFQESAWTASGSSLNLSIPDFDSTGVQSSITVASTYVTEAVQIQLSVNHTHIGDVQVELTSPSGTKSIILNANNALYTDTSYSGATFLSNAFYGEPSQGVWKIRLLDGATGNTGKLQQWKIKVFGH